jgi:hypothetical protein
VRTVLVARDDQPFWGAVELLLARANARVVSCTGAEILEAAAETGPDLVVLGPETHRMAGSYLGRAQIVMNGEPASGVRLIDATRPAVAHAGWPLSEETFLELTARMLRVAERRTFRALVRILRPRLQQTFMGQSEDFSLSGMALRSAVALERGEPIVVSLHLPGSKGSIQLLGEVTREATDPVDGSRYYGVRFLNLDPPLQRKLRDFVWEG